MTTDCMLLAFDKYFVSIITYFLYYIYKRFGSKIIGASNFQNFKMLLSNAFIFPERLCASMAQKYEKRLV